LLIGMGSRRMVHDLPDNEALSASNTKSPCDLHHICDEIPLIQKMGDSNRQSAPKNKVKTTGLKHGETKPQPKPSPQRSQGAQRTQKNKDRGIYSGAKIVASRE